MEEERGSYKNKSLLLSKGKKEDIYHVLYKVPYGDSPYVRAKHAQVYILYIHSSITLFVYLSLSLMNDTDSFLLS